jgi:hypothetical protein
MDYDEEYRYQHLDVLPLKLEIKDIHDYISPRTHYTGDSYIIDRINQDSMPVRVDIRNNTELEKYNKWLIDSIENHQTDSKKVAFKIPPRDKRYVFKILSVKRKSSDKPIDVSSDNILLTANQMYANKAEIKEYKAKDLALSVIANTKSRVSNKKEEKLERIAVILVKLLAEESLKAKSSKLVKGKDNINIAAISSKIVELAGIYEINDGLSNDASLATEINAILKQYPKLKNI